MDVPSDSTGRGPVIGRDQVIEFSDYFNNTKFDEKVMGGMGDAPMVPVRDVLATMLEVGIDSKTIMGAFEHTQFSLPDAVTLASVQNREKSPDPSVNVAIFGLIDDIKSISRVPGGVEVLLYGMTQAAEKAGLEQTTVLDVFAKSGVAFDQTSITLAQLETLTEHSSVYPAIKQELDKQLSNYCGITMIPEALVEHQIAKAQEPHRARHTETFEIGGKSITIRGLPARIGVAEHVTNHQSPLTGVSVLQTTGRDR